ncbi:hypothetical protein F-liban_350 [Faustovirus]|nr:hypothetical protein F-liban_350 [Faustovirus]
MSTVQYQAYPAYYYSGDSSTNSINNVISDANVANGYIKSNISTQIDNKVASCEGGEANNSIEKSIAKQALVVISTRARVFTSNVTFALGKICKWLSYGCIAALVGNTYAQHYHLAHTTIPLNSLRYYSNKLEYTTSDYLDYYNVRKVDNTLSEIKTSIKTSGVLLAAGVALHLLNKAFTHVTRQLL